MNNYDRTTGFYIRASRTALKRVGLLLLLIIQVTSVFEKTIKIRLLKLPNIYFISITITPGSKTLSDNKNGIYLA